MLNMSCCDQIVAAGVPAEFMRLSVFPEPTTPLQLAVWGLFAPVDGAKEN